MIVVIATVIVAVIATVVVFATMIETAFGPARGCDLEPGNVGTGDVHVESSSDYTVIGTFASKDVKMSRVFKLAQTSDGTLVSVVDLEGGGVLLTRERSLDDFEPLQNNDLKPLGTFLRKIGNDTSSMVFKLARKTDGTLVSVTQMSDGRVELTPERSLDDFVRF
jgi:hypothetical protein